MTLPPTKHGQARVERVDECDLISIASAWAFADKNRDRIESHWHQRCTANPGFFNGTVHLLREHGIAGAVFKAKLARMPFKDFLYWKDSGYPDDSVSDVFGSALLRSLEGHVILGRQREGNLNAGLAYLPGGFIDERDIGAGGRVDIAASVLRELGEEIGIGNGLARQQPGFFITFAGRLVSIGVEFRSHLPAAQIVEGFERHISNDSGSELASVEIVRQRADLDRLPVPDYAAAVICAVLPGFE